jgi:PAS domain S-box-containing protein
MKDEDKTRGQLLAECVALRQRVIELEMAEAERQRAEEARRESEPFYCSLIEVLPQSLCCKDLEGRFTFGNQKFCDSLNRTLDEIIGKTDFDLHPSELAEKYRQDDKWVIETGQTFETIEEHFPLDGDKTYVQVIKTPIRDASGEITGIQVIFWDVTERRRAEEELRKHREHLEKLVEARTAELEAINEQFEQEIAERGHVEERLERLAIQLALLNDIGGRIAAVLELDSVLARAAHLVQESFSYHHVALFTVDRERGDLVMRAKAGAFAHLFPPNHRLKLEQGMVGWVGYHGERLLANDVDAEPRYVNLYPDLVPTRSELSVPIRLGEQVVGVLDVQSPALNAFGENDVIVIETLADQIAVAIENARLYEAVQRELTERKRAEKRLERYATDLEQANEEVKRFAYIVSHDLRAPLVNCQGFAAELRLALDVIRSAMGAASPYLDENRRQAVTVVLEEDIPEALGFIESSVVRMDRFVNALLKLSRLGRRELALELIDMNTLSHATLQTLAYQIEERQVKVTVGSLPEVVADRTSMEQILGNILTNAVIYLDPDRLGEIEITAERDSDETTFHIRDNGRGIAEDDLDKVFAPFRRAGRQDVPGEGMGLAYVQTLVRHHGGQIWCESKLGEGTTLTFTISNHLGREGNHV